jgi:molybdopterin-guanine dinucleotide biosynthesis protein A
MPFLNTELLDHMLGQTTDYDAVVPRLETGLIEPLHAVYSRNCLEKMKERVERGQLAVESLIEALRVKYVQQEEICRLDPELPVGH